LLAAQLRIADGKISHNQMLNGEVAVILWQQKGGPPELAED
jgi:hypothetical protein